MSETPSRGSLEARLLAWIEERVDLGMIHYLIEKKRVPVHRHSVWYYFGGMALFLFVVQILSGILLLGYYRPTEDGAFESVQFIVADVEFGWLIRNVHSWAANILVGVLFVHMFSTFLMKAYRKPRELTWMTGVQPLRTDLDLRLHRLSAAVERTVLLRHQGRYPDLR